VLFQQLADRAAAQTAGIPRVAVGQLVMQFVAAEGDLFGVDDDDVIAAIGLCLPRNRVAAATARRPSTTSVASMTYHDLVVSPAFGA
jgi:hypothetical protein